MLKVPKTIVPLTALLLIAAAGLPAPASAQAPPQPEAPASEERDITPGQILAEHVTGGQVWSSPAHHGSTVFIGSDDGALSALDAATLGPRWKVPSRPCAVI